MLDGGYISDPSIFYVPMEGKVEFVAGQRLKPENVCWDVTSPADLSASDGLPLVFLTGYKVNYVPGGAAVPYVKPYPEYYPRSWWEKLHGEPLADYHPWIAVCYKSNSASVRFVNTSATENPDHSIPNFVPANFDAQGKTYRQLTPDGVLPDK